MPLSLFLNVIVISTQIYGMLQDNIFAFYDIPNLAMPRSEKPNIKIGLSYNEVVVST
jgi:hypothetical protein